MRFGEHRQCATDAPSAKMAKYELNGKPMSKFDERAGDLHSSDDRNVSPILWGRRDLHICTPADLDYKPSKRDVDEQRN